MNSLFIFNLDGVLIDSRRDLCVSINRLRADFDLDPIELGVLKSNLEFGCRDLILKSIGRVDVSDADILSTFYKYYCQTMFEATKLYIGVNDGIKRLHSVRHRLAVLSDKPTNITHMILDHFLLTQYMYMVIGDGGDHPPKPNPSLITMMAHEAEADINNVWLVTDNESDLKMATQAGVKRAFAKYGYGKSDPELYDLKILSFIDFEKYIDGRCSL